MVSSEQNKYNFISKMIDINCGLKNFPSFYHYTSLESFCNGILCDVENKGICMHATNCAFLNDTQEIKAGLEVLKIVLNRETNSLIDKHKKNTFLISFSGKADSLPMWIMYGKGGVGINLEFSPIHSNWTDGYGVYECCYSTEEYFNKLKCYMDIGSQNKIEESLYKVLRDMIIVTTPYVIKNNAYKFENEIRLIGSLCGLETLYAVRNGIIRPYKALYFPKEQLKSITIGPAAKTDEIKKILRNFLDKKGLQNVEIKQSIIPYRYI